MLPSLSILFYYNESNFGIHTHTGTLKKNHPRYPFYLELGCKESICLGAPLWVAAEMQ